MPPQPDLDTAAREARLREALEHTLLETLLPLSSALALLYALFALAHLWVMPRGLAEPLAALAGATALALLALRRLLAGGSVAARRAHAVGALIGGLVLANSAVHLALTRDPRQTTNLLLLAVGAGYVLLDTRFLLALLAALSLAWSVVAVSAGPAADWGHFGFALCAALALSLGVHAGRRRSLRRIEGLRLANEEHQAEIAARERKTRALLFALPDAHFRMRRDGTYLEALLKRPEDSPIPPERLVGRRIDDVMPAHLIAPIRSCIEAALETGELQVFHYRLPFGPDQEREYEARLARSDADEVLAVVRDVTERRQVEQQLRAAKEAADAAREQAEQANRAKSRFLASMSHELRTPLNAILGFAQLMAREARPPRDQEYLDVINRSGEHLLRLINDVLSLSKIEAGRVALSLAAFDPGALVRSTAEMLGVRARAKGLELEYETQGLPPAVLGDEGKLRQILLNLLGNAVKFTQAGGVKLRATWRDGRARFDVADTGPGIAADEQQAVFQTFVQAQREAPGSEGTGLGLAISRSFARLMGGDVTLVSLPGHGTSVRCEVDLAAAPGPAPAATEPRRVVGLAPGQRRVRVIVADDNPDSRRLIAALLASVGFTVIEAADGQEALQAWEREPIDLVFMDLRMPVMDGRAATRAIRARSRVPIVALTASVFEGDAGALLEEGFDQVILKPFREDQIFDALARLLGVTYAYDRPAPSVPAPARPLSAESFAALPPGLLDALRRAVAGADHELAMEAVAGMETSDPDLARDVRARLDRYAFDEIEAALPSTTTERNAAE